MPKRPTKEVKKACKKQKDALDLTEELMDILREELEVHLDSNDYEDDVIVNCGIDGSLFEPDKESELADALNTAFDGSTGKCRQSLIGILEYRTEGAILMFDMKRTLDFIEKRQKEYDKCVHKET